MSEKMTDLPTITLRYFDVRGRGQFIRALLTHREIPFTDERVSLSDDLSSWQETRQDRTVSGAFQKMPTLAWGDIMVSEVLVILEFLQQKLGDEALLGEKEDLNHDMLRSSAYLDLLRPCIDLIWCDIFNPGVDVAQTTQVVKGRLAMHLATVNQTLKNWDWNKKAQDRPVMGADCLLWEALDAITLTFANTVAIADFSELYDFYCNSPGTNTFKRLLNENPNTLTARPGEAQALARIHSSL